MTTTFAKGVKRVVTYYLIGLALAVIIHITVGWKNKALIPPSFMVVIFLSMIAFPWSFLNITDLNCPIKRPQSTGELLMHLLFFVFLAGFIWYIRN